MILTRLDSLTLLTLLGISLTEVSLNDVLWDIQKIGFNTNDPHMDGFYQWGQKQKLYQILWEVEKQLKNCSEFYGEDQWLKDHEEDVILDKLKGQ
jgi:hypothetical protein